MVREILMRSRKQQPNSPFQVGSQAYFIFGRSRMKGVITGDRGAIGAREPPLIGEFPAEALQPA